MHALFFDTVKGTPQDLVHLRYPHSTCAHQDYGEVLARTRTTARYFYVSGLFSSSTVRVSGQCRVHRCAVVTNVVQIAAEMTVSRVSDSWTLFLPHTTLVT